MTGRVQRHTARIAAAAAMQRLLPFDDPSPGPAIERDTAAAVARARRRGPSLRHEVERAIAKAPPRPSLDDINRALAEATEEKPWKG